MADCLPCPPSSAASPVRKQGGGNPGEQPSKQVIADVGAGGGADANSAPTRRRSSVRRGSADGGEEGERRGSQQVHSRRVSRVLRVSHLQVRKFESCGTDKVARIRGVRLVGFCVVDGRRSDNGKFSVGPAWPHVPGALLAYGFWTAGAATIAAGQEGLARLCRKRRGRPNGRGRRRRGGIHYEGK